MEKQIKKLVGKQELSKVKELNLSNCESTNVIGLSEDYKSLETLQIDGVGLTTLKSFPRLVNLKKLQLTNNLISEGLDALASLPKLSVIDLSGNKIKDLDVLQPLTEISTITDINLKGCEITEIKNYRTKVFELFPGLKCLDGVKNPAADTTEVVDLEEEEEEEEDDDDAVVAAGSDVDDEEDDEVDDEEEDIESSDVDEEDAGSVPLKALYYKTFDENDDEDEEEDKDFEGEELDEEQDLDEEEEGDEDAATVANLSVEKVDSKTRGKKRKAAEEVGEVKVCKK